MHPNPDPNPITITKLLTSVNSLFSVVPPCKWRRRQREARSQKPDVEKESPLFFALVNAHM